MQSDSPTSHGPSPRDELIVGKVGISGEGLKTVLRDHFKLDEKDVIHFSNRYFSTSISMRAYSERDLETSLQDDSFLKALRLAPAVAIVTASDRGSISRSKSFATRISNHCSESVAAVLYIHEESIGEEEVMKLVRWGLQYNFEIVTESICQDDGLEVATRLEQALECAQWKHVVSKPSENLPEQDGAEEIMSDEESLSSPECKFTEATRLRRGLNEQDVEKLIGSLLLDDESDSDR